MPKLILRPLKEEDEAAFNKIVSEFKQFDPNWDFALGRNFASSFSEYVDLLESWSKGKKLPEGHVPSSFLAASVSGTLIGRSSIRHELNSFLLEKGGHIGYGVSPSERKKGYGKLILKASLEHASKLGIKKVLVTCDEDNILSRKIIESCHGKYENTLDGTRRYWIE